MTRFSAVALTGASIALAATVTIQAQQPAAPPGAAPGAGRGGRGQAITLPDGNAKPFIQAMCVTCHQLNMITGSAGSTDSTGIDLIRTMVLLPEEQYNVVGGLPRDELSGEAGTPPDARARRREDHVQGMDGADARPAAARSAADCRTARSTGPGCSRASSAG